MEEKIFIIDVGPKLLKAPRWEKSKRAAFEIRRFLQKHMKAKNIKIGESINQEIWKSGDQKPPKKLKIKVIKTEEDGEEVVKAEIWGHVFEEEIKTEKGKPEKEEVAKKEEKDEDSKLAGEKSSVK